MRDAMYVKYVGTLFLSMLKCIIIPLVIPSLISAIGSMDLSLSGKVGVRAIVYYLVTTVFAVILGIILVVTIRPGGGQEHLAEEQDLSNRRNITTADTLMDLVRNMFPPNIVAATMHQTKLELIYPGENNVFDDEGNLMINVSNKDTWKFKKMQSNSTNILGLVVFAVVTGIAIAHPLWHYHAFPSFQVHCQHGQRNSDGIWNGFELGLFQSPSMRWRRRTKLTAEYR